MAAPEKAAQPVSGKASPEVLARFEKDVEVMHESIRLMLGNRLADAEELLNKAGKEVEARQIDFAAGDHDLRGSFAFLSALMGLVNGLASLENNQLDTVLERVFAADDLLALDGDWAGKTVLRGLCLLVAGLVEIMQGGVTRGVWHVLRSWLFLRYLESEGLHFQGHEHIAVRSTALLALGVFSLFTSMLPPQAMRTAGWITGFTGGRDTALAHLMTCWEEGGIQAPFAGLAVVGFAVDVSSFLGEPRAEREARHEGARRILDWAAERYPGAFFFEGLEAAYLAAERDLDTAVARLEKVQATVQDLPAFLFLVHIRIATFQVVRFEWSSAAAAWRAALEVHRTVGRRASCPAFALNAYLCHLAAGEEEEAAQALELCRSYRHVKKKWAYIDRSALAEAERVHRAQARARGEEVEDQADLEEEHWVWRPMLTLYLKLCVVYRGVNFMRPEQADTFCKMVQRETDACRGADGKEEDVDGVLLGLFVQAEARRQCESWDEALRLAGEGLGLADRVSPAGRRSGSLQYCQLISAWAHYAQGRPAAAKEALAKLDGLGSDSAFSKQVDFKATHLRRLVGAELKDSYAEVAVGGRSKARLVVAVPADAGSVEWDWVLQDFSINFMARFISDDASADASVVPTELQRTEQHTADKGPVVGSFEAPGAGRLELIFDNSFSLLRGKTVQCRVQPSSLAVVRDDEF